jgi:hypothetical protein
VRIALPCRYAGQRPDCLAVEAVCSEPVSAKFPDDGKTTGTFLCYLPNFSQNQAVSYCNKTHNFIFGNGSEIHKRELSGNSSIPLQLAFVVQE